MSLCARYFRKGPYFGLSVYQKRRVQSDSERGARMKAVGVISRGYETLHLHIPFLQEQCRLLLEDSFSYDPLIAYLESQKTLKNPDHDTLLTSEVPELGISTPIGHFSQFVRFYGPSVFALWRLILLQSKILFYSPPPLEISCYRGFPPFFFILSFFLFPTPASPQHLF